METEPDPGSAASGPHGTNGPNGANKPRFPWLSAAFLQSFLHGRRAIFAALAAVLVLGTVTTAILVSVNRPAAPAAAPSSSPVDNSITATAGPLLKADRPTPPLALPGLPAGPVNVLVIGSDIRGNAKEAIKSGARADHRADTLMLMHIPADRKKVYGISIMRDLWVDIPGYGGSKINASLEIGGTALVAKTVGNLLNTRIHHTVMVDFNTFRSIVDGLGGIEVNVSAPFTSTHDSRHSFRQGVNRLNGQQALEFVRERYAFSDGDYQRVRNQQEFIRAVMAKLRNSGVLKDAGKTLAFITKVAPKLILDNGLDVMKLAGLAYTMRDVDPRSASFMTLPTAGTGVSGDGQSIVLPDYNGIAQVTDALAKDRMGQLPR
jgi:polyisoprenyl-teichoic acid--peptidoglycan teichoic acid transferase